MPPGLTSSTSVSSTSAARPERSGVDDGDDRGAGAHRGALRDGRVHAGQCGAAAGARRAPRRRAARRAGRSSDGRTAGGGAAELDDAGDRRPQGERVDGRDRQVVRLLGLQPLGRAERADRPGQPGDALLHRPDRRARPPRRPPRTAPRPRRPGLEQRLAHRRVGDLAGRLAGRVERLARPRSSVRRPTETKSCRRDATAGRRLVERRGRRRRARCSAAGESMTATTGALGDPLAGSTAQVAEGAVGGRADRGGGPGGHRAGRLDDLGDGAAGGRAERDPAGLVAARGRGQRGQQDAGERAGRPVRAGDTRHERHSNPGVRRIPARIHPGCRLSAARPGRSGDGAGRSRSAMLGDEPPGRRFRTAPRPAATRGRAACCEPTN